MKEGLGVKARVIGLKDSKAKVPRYMYMIVVCMYMYCVHVYVYIWVLS